MVNYKTSPSYIKFKSWGHWVVEGVRSGAEKETGNIIIFDYNLILMISFKNWSAYDNFFQT